MSAIDDVLATWFGALDASGRAAPDIRARWFRKDPAFDAMLRERFGALVESAMRGELDTLQDDARGSLAYLILLDQLPRNIYRGQARMYAGDERALPCAHRAIARGFHRAMGRDPRAFFLMPLMHSEALADQERCVELFEEAVRESEGEDK